MLQLETRRLRIRTFRRTDAGALITLFSDPRVMKYSEGVRSADWVQDWIRQCMDEAERGVAISHWAIEEKTGSSALGYCGLFQYPDIDGQPEIEIGYRLLRSSWGKGYATEALCAVRDHGFHALGIRRLVALIDPENKASINVAEKAGFRYEKEVWLAGYSHSDYLYVNNQP